MTKITKERENLSHVHRISELTIKNRIDSLVKEARKLKESEKKATGRGVGGDDEDDQAKRNRLLLETLEHVSYHFVLRTNNCLTYK